MPSNNFLTAAKRILRVIVPIAVGIFLAWQIYTNWHQIAPQITHANVWLLIAAFCANIFLYPLAAFSWYLILQALGEEVTFHNIFPVWMTAHLTKYIPGTIWQYLGRIELAKKIGINRSITLVSLVYETLTYLIAGAMLTLLLLGKVMVVAALAVLAASILLLPLALQIIRTRIPKFKDIPDTRLPLRTILGVIILNIGDFFATGIALWLIINAFHATALNPLHVTSIYAFAWLIGYLTFLAPAGLGVADVTLVGLLTPHFGIGLASLVAIILRIMIFGNELLLGLVTLKLWRKQK